MVSGPYPGLTKGGGSLIGWGGGGDDPLDPLDPPGYGPGFRDSPNLAECKDIRGFLTLPSHMNVGCLIVST